MNCREVQSLLSTERDGLPEATAPAGLEKHLAECPLCRRLQTDLAAGFSTWRREGETVTVPDANHEWFAVRRRIRGGVAAGTTVALPRQPLRYFWRVLPLAVATAIALAVFLPWSTTGDSGAGVARAESVEVPGGRASTMVFVDDKSGWLIVWASDANGSSE